jgi:hypothetical protein
MAMERGRTILLIVVALATCAQGSPLGCLFEKCGGWQKSMEGGPKCSSVLNCITPARIEIASECGLSGGVPSDLGAVETIAQVKGESCTQAVEKMNDCVGSAGGCSELGACLIGRLAPQLSTARRSGHGGVSRRSWTDQKQLQYADDAGHWGTWRAWAMCPTGHFAIGFQQRNEANQGPVGDDSALNAVRMLCSDQSTISSYDGLWGSWSSLVQCGSGSSFDAYRIRIEADQGGGDDTAAGSVEMYCGNEQVSATGTAWGDWKPKRMCGQGYKICGFRIRFESDQGEGDDSAMNGIEVRCCGDQESSPAPPPASVPAPPPVSIYACICMCVRLCVCVCVCVTVRGAGCLLCNADPCHDVYSLSLCLSLSLSLSHTHTRTHTYIYMHTHTHTHTQAAT